MFVVMTYDVDTKRTAKAMKTAKRYMRWVQRSVFEGDMTEGGLASLKTDLARILDPEHDKVLFYVWPHRQFVSCKGMGICAGRAGGGTTNFI